MKVEFTNGKFLLNGCVFNTQQIGCTFDESIRNGLMTFFTAANQIFFIVKFPGRKRRQTEEAKCQQIDRKSFLNDISDSRFEASSNI